jgi:hypothetical protein
MVNALYDPMTRRGGLLMTIRAHRFIAAGALAVAAVAAPITIALTSADIASNAAPPKCLSTVTTNGSDPQCVGYSNGQPMVGATPGGLYGPSQNSGFGVNSGQLLPGQTWSTPVG